MTLKTKIARFILIVLAAAAATSAPGIAQETPAATKNTLPAVRTMTAADGRKLEGTILSKDATSIQFRRTTDGKEFMLELSKLSAQDQAFIDTLHAPAPGDHLIGDWVCNGVPTDIYSIKDDKSAIHLTDPGTWQVTDQLLTIQWVNGYRLTIDTTQTGATVIAKSYPPRSNHIDVIKFSKKRDLAPAPTLPIKRTLTTADGRKLEGTILSNDANSIQFRRTTDNKEFTLELSKLSSDDQKFIAELTDAPQKGADEEATETHSKGWPADFQFKTTLVQPQKLAFLALPFDKQEPGGICAAASTLNILQFLDPSLQMGQRELMAVFNSEVSGASPTQIVAGIQTMGFNARLVDIEPKNDIREDLMWRIRRSLDSKLPLLAANSGHAFTLIGYNREEEKLILWDQRMRGKPPENGLPDGASEVTESQFFSRVKTLIFISPMPPVLGNNDFAKATGLPDQFKKNQIINGDPRNERMGAFLRHASEPTITVALKKNLRVFIQDKTAAVEILQEPDGSKWKCQIYPPNRSEDVTSSTINNLLEKSEGVFYTVPK